MAKTRTEAMWEAWRGILEKLKYFYLPYGEAGFDSFEGKWSEVALLYGRFESCAKACGEKDLVRVVKPLMDSAGEYAEHLRVFFDYRRTLEDSSPDDVEYIARDYSRGVPPQDMYWKLFQQTCANQIKLGCIKSITGDRTDYERWWKQESNLVNGGIEGCKDYFMQPIDKLATYLHTWYLPNGDEGPEDAQQGQAVGGGQPKPDKGKTPKRSWIQSDLDEAIRKYKAERARNYADMVDRVRQGKKGAKQAARKIFGRNAIARKLGVKSPKMVGKSPDWRTIAADLELSRPTGSRNTPKADRVGLEIANEEASEKAAKAGGTNEATRAMIRKLAESGKKNCKEAAEELFNDYQAGDMTDFEVCQTVEILLKSD